MSSTSFSSYEDHEGLDYSCVLEDHYGRFIEPVPPDLYYNRTYTLCTQPLIYYAQVQPSNLGSVRGVQKRKENKNCFVKAFKWYTQERPAENRRIRSAELHGFATWLDTKYSEYLRDADTDQLIHHPTKVVADSCPCRTTERDAAGRFSRIKCPWKSRKYQSKKIAGTEPGKTLNASCEFILKPKDLTRPLSECCYTTVCSNINNAVVASTDGEKTRQITRKSQSMTNICHERVVQDFIDVMVIQDEVDVGEVAKTLTSCHEKCTTVVEIKREISKICESLSLAEEEFKIIEQKPLDATKFKKPLLSKANCNNKINILNATTTKPSQQLYVDIECQCPKQIGTVDEQIQYEKCHDSFTSTASKNSVCKRLIHIKSQPDPVQTKATERSTQSCSRLHTNSKTWSKISSVKSRKNDAVCQCPEEDVLKFDAYTQYDGSYFDMYNANCICQIPEKPSCKYDDKETDISTGGTITLGKATRSLTVFRNGDVQTSDHSIDIETSDGHECVYFVKIMCADKVKGCGCD